MLLFQNMSAVLSEVLLTELENNFYGVKILLKIYLRDKLYRQLIKLERTTTFHNFYQEQFANPNPKLIWNPFTCEVVSRG